MKKILIASSLAIAFIIAGCSEKTSVEADNTATETVKNDNMGNDNDLNGNSTIDNSGEDRDMNMVANNDNRNIDSLNSVYFKFDKFNIEGEDNINTIKNNAQSIIDSTYEVKVEGNTDEWGSDEYNYALALKRASSVKDALVSNNVPAEKIQLVSYGESKPKCLEKTKQCWQENRRVDFVLIPAQ